MSGKNGPLRWRSAGQRAPFAGKSLLTTHAGHVLAVSDFHCYVQTFADGRMLSWYVATTANGAVIRLMLFDIDHLRPVGDVERILALLGASQRLVTAVDPSGVFEISTALPDGSQMLDVPEPFRQLGELLLLAPSTADGRHEDHFNEMHQRLWIIKPSTGELSVVPQDWFNRGPYDFGYQWITRMARVPESGAIVGEGIRLGVFELDASHRHVAEWLIADTFYHPEREQFTSDAPEA